MQEIQLKSNAHDARVLAAFIGVGMRWIRFL